MDAFMHAVLPQLLEIAGLILTAVLTWAAAKAKAKWGIEIEARHREALHSAIMTGINLALSKGLTAQAAVDAALDYATKSVPDAIGALKPSAETIADLAKAKLQEAAFEGIKSLRGVNALTAVSKEVGALSR
ncbi:hypothetical protein RGQ15_11665 [Paracoccus sp. MBLB3053]|uniref:Uncharacterized protein n=1 Tax=Paracoccus aurantius TaxID=3073814 RepID=A0ABU2HT48_9RHOB|nr:hypothetical protein [Paracoccus sp. MBLB3053]MDS9468224.1 hypothetical protein [Paracoccus sp. MBLB3053]